MGKESKKHKSSKKDHKEKRRKRDRSPSTDSSDEEDRKRQQASKLAKKVERNLKKHSLGGFGYTDEDNPFGDVNLSERFVWGKKIEKQLTEGVNVDDLTAKAERRRQGERIEEVEKVKTRREQREAERAAMAEELDMIQRERAMAEAVGLERKEEEFHLEQAKVRARQRLEAARPKAIDLITNNLFLLDGFDPGEDDPSAVVSSLNIYQLRELKQDVATYRELDARDASHAAFWDALAAVTAYELAEATKQDEIDRARMRGLPPPAKYSLREAGWHESLEADVGAMLAGKTYSQLTSLEQGIQDQLNSGEAADPDYWGAVLRRLGIAKARSALREFHADLMERHLQRVMAGEDVPQSLGPGAALRRREQADAEAARAQEEEAARRRQEAEDVAAAAAQAQVEVRAAAAAALAPVRAGAAAAEGGEEIELPEEEEDEGEGGAGAGPEGELDAELEALAAKDIRLPGAGPAAAEGEAGAPAAATAAAAAAAEHAARGEPRAWDDLSDGEQDGVATGSAGEFSPRPLAPEHVTAQNVIPEEEDLRMLELLRMQVKFREAQRFKEAAAAAAAAAGSRGGSVSVDADRLYRQMVANPRAAGPLLGATNPLLKYLADAAPQRGEQAMRSGDAGAAASGEAGQEGPEQEARLRAAAARSMGDMSSSGDAPFGGEVPVSVDSQVYWWHEKYRPRKPKYFNRVHTGYDWNKYNKTHYDGDNPPPKIVQGYKFNIFFPDLIDPTKAPTYSVERDPSSEDGSTCLLRFAAGPPYEDVAFRIINKDWEYNHKRGFKCVFERGILHLYFNFRRQFYRR